ncbi:PREDICTED: rootletin-like [Corvus brachyrhynchos]|uniref:rootletin-like n=1 Tax=Corvus brachyrhynchos TaxID=85066 RepID=UPI0008164FEA|nr:PREDICTED: rootletin-like [Corvus brachyrhynchos]XP_017592140.1 PREDICTED: rootletin-like [Corvus brachyrhynchos]XP_017592141.1 PREDICTED: rootletin-like [Corvus brachyrhynchos]
METQQEARGLGMSHQFTSQILSHQRLSPGAPEVGELTSRLAAPRESQELTVHKAQQDRSEALEREKARPTLTLEEKELSFRSLEENNLAQIKQVSQLYSALHRGEQLLSDRIGELQELSTQSDARKKIQALKLQLSTTQAQRDHFSACNQELQKQLAESQEAMWRAERKNSLETALKEEATARKAEVVTLHRDVASLQRKLDNTEKERKDVLHERDSLKANKEKLEHQIKLLEESVTASEIRANAVIDRNRSLQEELQTIMSIFQVKKEKLETQEKEMEMLQKEAAEAKALQKHVTRMAADLSERERETKLYQEQMKMLEKEEFNAHSFLAKEGTKPNEEGSHEGRAGACGSCFEAERKWRTRMEREGSSPACCPCQE